MSLDQKIMKPSVVRLASIFLAFGYLISLHAQNDKDAKTYEKLESEIRKDAEKVISQFNPTQVMSEPAPLALRVRYDKFKDITTVGFDSQKDDERKSLHVLRIGDRHIELVNFSPGYSYPGQQPIKPDSDRKSVV